MTKIEQWLKECEIYNYVVFGDKYFIGKHNVMFGTRVRGGFIFDGGCDFDICCGTNVQLADRVIQIYDRKVLKNMELGLAPATGLIAMSKIKPIHKDLEYMQWLTDLREDLSENLKNM